MTRLVMLAATLAVIWPPLGGQAQSAPISPSGAAAFAGSPSAQQIGWRGCGFWQAKCAVRCGGRERGGSDGVCGDTAAGGRLPPRRPSSRSDPSAMDLPKS